MLPWTLFRYRDVTQFCPRRGQGRAVKRLWRKVPLFLGRSLCPLALPRLAAAVLKMGERLCLGKRPVENLRELGPDHDLPPPWPPCFWTSDSVGQHLLMLLKPLRDEFPVTCSPDHLNQHKRWRHTMPPSHAEKPG